MDWRHRALCTDYDPEIFFPVGDLTRTTNADGHPNPAIAQVQAAKAICRRCPVIFACLNWAIDSGQDAGVWGGLDENERRELRRRERGTSARTASRV